jgi:hypothetical protein
MLQLPHLGEVPVAIRQHEDAVAGAQLQGNSTHMLRW